MDGLVFGWRTAVLCVAISQLLLLAFAILRTPVNRAANRILAGLLLVLAGILTPWTIGFAGFYDRWRWLTFAPFAITLAVGPLVWLYVRTLAEGVPPRRRWLHLAAPIGQFAYLLACFCLPQSLKAAWAHTSAGFAAALQVLAALSLAAYGAASLSALGRYRRRLADHRSDDARFALRWLGRAIVASFVLLPVWAAYGVWDAAAPLGYFNLMGLYVAIAAFALYLGIEGWRHASIVFPAPPVIAATPSAVRDWAGQGRAWAERVRAADWAADPELSLATLASRLGTNTGYLSKALNEGLGVNFSTFVNGLRAERVADRLMAGDSSDLLNLALEAGFASKASFNRAFKIRYRSSPSAFRRRVSNPENPIDALELEAHRPTERATPAA